MEVAIKLCVVGGLGEHLVRLDDRRAGINPLVLSGLAGTACALWSKFGKHILNSGSSGFESRADSFEALLGPEPARALSSGASGANARRKVSRQRDQHKKRSG